MHPTSAKPVQDYLAEKIQSTPANIAQLMFDHQMNVLREVLRTGFDLAEQHHKVGPYAPKAGAT